jgi:hypothetical protein
VTSPAPLAPQNSFLQTSLPLGQASALAPHRVGALPKVRHPPPHKTRFCKRAYPPADLSRRPIRLIQKYPVHPVKSQRLHLSPNSPTPSKHPAPSPTPPPRTTYSITSVYQAKHHPASTQPRSPSVNRQPPPPHSIPRNLPPLASTPNRPPQSSRSVSSKSTSSGHRPCPPIPDQRQHQESHKDPILPGHTPICYKDPIFKRLLEQKPTRTHRQINPAMSQFGQRGTALAHLQQSQTSAPHSSPHPTKKEAGPQARFHSFRILLIPNKIPSILSKITPHTPHATAFQFTTFHHAAM